MSLLHLLTIAMITLATPVLAQMPVLRIAITDGDPYDRIRITNIGDCKVVSGVLTLDFEQSQGKVIIDTAYGGVGTKDPMPVAVEHGPITVAPVFDGDTSVTITINGLIPMAQGVVTLDFDNNASVWFSRRVEVFSEDFLGTVATLGGSQSVFQSGSQLEMPLPATVCDDDGPDEVLIPIS